MKQYYLAIDIGASSGRHILFHRENGHLCPEQIYRFPNAAISRNGSLCWDYEALYGHILAGLRRCQELGKIPVSLGIDTWGVDFLLLDDRDQVIGDMVSYRDHRTAGMDSWVSRQISDEALYRRTGIQKGIYNTIYQLAALKHQHPEQLRLARSFLMVPDYFHWKLCGVKVNEYTQASTSQLLDAAACDWDWELIRTLGFPEGIFQPIRKPGTVLGSLTPQVQQAVGFCCQVVLPPSHDTASAIAAVPYKEPGGVFISSGTWSLMGVEREKPDCSPESCRLNFTNEGGYGDSICYLKNIMGLWMIQCVRKELEEQGTPLSFAQLCSMAAEESIPSIVPCNDDRFLSPPHMIRQLQQCCRESGQPVPHTPAQLAAVVYNSLAHCYRQVLEQLQERMGTTYPAIHIIGGGSNAEHLNVLTARTTGCTVYSGPDEATAIGNAVVQMLCFGEFSSLQQARADIARSFPVNTFPPSPSNPPTSG